MQSFGGSNQASTIGYASAGARIADKSTCLPYIPQLISGISWIATYAGVLASPIAAYLPRIAVPSSISRFLAGSSRPVPVANLLAGG